MCWCYMNVWCLNMCYYFEGYQNITQGQELNLYFWYEEVFNQCFYIILINTYVLSTHISKFSTNYHRFSLLKTLFYKNIDYASFGVVWSSLKLHSVEWLQRNWAVYIYSRQKGFTFTLFHTPNTQLRICWQHSGRKQTYNINDIMEWIKYHTFV